MTPGWIAPKPLNIRSVLIWKIVNLSRLYIPQYPDLFHIADNWDDVQPLALGVHSVQASNKMFQEYFECLRKAQHGLSLENIWSRLDEESLGNCLDDLSENEMEIFWQVSDNLKILFLFQTLEDCKILACQVVPWCQVGRVLTIFYRE